jgi:hypothetical protein
MPQDKKAPEIWVVASVDPNGTLYAYEQEGNFYLTPDVAGATKMNLLKAEKTREALNVEFKKLSTSYDRFSVISLKPTDK